MILTVDQVRPYILHEDVLVSNAAMEYMAMSRAYRDDAELMPLVIERLERNLNESFHLFHARRFKQTESTIAALVSLLNNPDTKSNYLHHIIQMLSAADLNLLAPYMEQLSQNEEIGVLVDTRQSVADMNDTDLLQTWHSYTDCLQDLSMDTRSTVYETELVEQMATRGCLTAAAVLDKLQEFEQNGYDYDRNPEMSMYFPLAGEMRLEAAIPYLCEALDLEEDDYIPELATEALVTIGTEAVVTHLENQYQGVNSEYYGLYASEIFGRIPVPLSEQAALRLLEADDNLTYSTKLAHSLCVLGSTEGIPAVEAMVRNDDYDRGYLHLGKSLYTCCIMTNTELPELASIRLEIDKEEQIVAARSAELSRLLAGNAKKTAGGKTLPGTGLYDAKPYVAEAKVGRNDPCTCGSGKKYKKCCGSAS
ncbi:SEC-C metal-binding domain-containing protein [Paenibacillus sp. GCM10023252]|uniref:SEC-C metal-binding domain-containing protein n=1 Tax=Paenibacillus sp. GCM10023252 TaxID=3252649 RepID=UPI00361CD07D